MIAISVRFRVLPEHAETWPALVEGFTTATRAEPGNLWFTWSRSLDDPCEYVLLEAFRDADAGAAHVGSDHFRAAMVTMPEALAETPRILNTEVPGDDWDRMGELEVPDRS